MPTINPHIFRAYDIRGIAIAEPPKVGNTAKPAVPQGGTNTPDLTAETVYIIGKATATYLHKEYKSTHMAVGRDVRTTSDKLQKAFIRGVLECGINVTDVGLSVSPMIYFASCKDDLQFDCGVNITASHNPKEYNGIKIVAANAHSICGPELQIIRELAEKEDFHKPKIKGQLKKENIWPAYRDELVSKVNRIKNPLKVVIDAGNGSAGPFAPELLAKTGATIIPLFCEPDGNFPNHEANPEDENNMRQLTDKVLETNADIGIGFDGDGDRIGIIDEKGRHYSSDYLLLLLTKDLLTRWPASRANKAAAQNSKTSAPANQNHGQPTPTNPKPQIVFDVKVSQAIINKMKELGATPVMSKTGHSFIEKKMKEIHAPLAGEVSGHMFFAENYYGFDDAFLAALKLIEILSTLDEPFSTLFEDLPKTFMTPEFKAHCPDDKKFAIVEALSAHFTSLYDCITIDGVRINFGPLAWGAVRASNTSPNLTLRFEAETPEKLQEIKTIMYEEIRKHPEVNLDWYKP